MDMKVQKNAFEMLNGVFSGSAENNMDRRDMYQPVGLGRESVAGVDDEGHISSGEECAGLARAVR